MKGKSSSRYPLIGIWLAGLLVSFAMCSSYLFMYSFRRIWQSHYPQLASQWANNGRFSVLGVYGTELEFEELAYSARAKNASEHHVFFDPYIKDSRSIPEFLNDSLTYKSLGLLGRITPDMSWAWILARFICCIAWFVLIYFLTLRLGEPPPFAFFCATFVTCFSYILTLLFLRQLDWHGGLAHIVAHDFWTVLSYGRTEGILRLPRPGLTYSALFLASLLCLKAIDKNDGRWMVLSGIVGGLLAYIRFDVWTGYVGAVWMLAVLLAIKGKPYKKLLVSAVLSSAMGLPILYINTPVNMELLIRNGIGFQRHFDFYSLPYLAAFVLGIRYYDKPAPLFFASLAASTFVLVNLELVTGYSLSPEHWKYFGNIYVFLLLVTFLPARFKSSDSLWLSLSAACALCAFLQGFSYASIHFPFSGIPRDYDDAFHWMDSHTSRDSVVLTINPEIDTLIPVFTHDKVFISFIMPVASDYPTLANTKRLLRGLDLLKADRNKFLNECIFSGLRQSDRRGSVASGLYRGDMEKHDAYYVFFCNNPITLTHQIMMEAWNHPADSTPDYIWMGHMEREYAGKTFFTKTGDAWVPVYQNPSVILYRRKAA